MLRRRKRMHFHPVAPSASSLFCNGSFRVRVLGLNDSAVVLVNKILNSGEGAAESDWAALHVLYACPASPTGCCPRDPALYPPLREYVFRLVGPVVTVMHQHFSLSLFKSQKSVSKLKMMKPRG